MVMMKIMNSKDDFILSLSLSLSLCIHICVCVYIYIYIQLNNGKVRSGWSHLYNLAGEVDNTHFLNL